MLHPLPCCFRLHSYLPAVLAFTLVSFGASASAADGPYVGVGGGLSLLNNSDVTAPAGDSYPPLNVTADVDAGFVVRGMAGYAFINGLRIEGEVGYRNHNIDTMNVKSPGALVELVTPAVATVINAGAITHQVYDPATTTYDDLSDPHKQLAVGAATGTQSISGDYSAFTFMANGYYDFDLGSDWKPYVGGGIGFSRISLDANSVATGRLLVDDDDTVFAYQVAGGVGYEFALSQGRSVTVSLDYRYFGTESPTFESKVVPGRDFETEIDGHDISVGLRYGF